MTTDDAGRYSVIEIEDMLAELARDNALSARICRYYNGLGCEPRCGLTAPDIMGDVWVDTLSGVRTWKRGIDTYKHFREAGHSIISNAADKHCRLEHLESEDHLYGESGALSIATSKLSLPSPSEEGLSKTAKHVATIKASHPPAENQLVENQRHMTLRELTNKVLEVFKNDSDAMCYLSQYMSENTVKAAIMAACSFTESVYNNVRKRIKDKARKQFSGGINWWEIKE